FKPGSFRLGTRAKVPIVPIAIDGTWQLYEKNNRRVKASTIHLVISEAIEPEEYEQMTSREMASHVQQIIEKQLKRTRRLIYKKNNMRVKYSTIHLVIREAIEPKEYEQMTSRELASHVQQIIEKQLKRTRRLQNKEDTDQPLKLEQNIG